MAGNTTWCVGLNTNNYSSRFPLPLVLASVEFPLFFLAQFLSEFLSLHLSAVRVLALTHHLPKPQGSTFSWLLCNQFASERFCSNLSPCPRLENWLETRNRTLCSLAGQGLDEPLRQTAWALGLDFSLCKMGLHKGSASVPHLQESQERTRE